jgi:hypothetical protein
MCYLVLYPGLNLKRHFGFITAPDREYIEGEHELSIQRVERQRERGREEAIVAVFADERRAEKSQRKRFFLWVDEEPPRT